jgi:hypothetical protein
MLTTILIGTAIGAGLAVAVILGAFEVRTKKSWEEHRLTVAALCKRIFTLTAENARLRFGLAAGEMTGDGKKIATMAMTALDAISTAESQAILKQKPSPA